MRRSAVIIGLALCFPGVGCTAVLGSFEVDETVDAGLTGFEAGAPDASTDETGTTSFDSNPCPFGKTLKGSACVPLCVPGYCGEHGTCADGDDGAVCTCGVEYAGAQCQFCALDYQDTDQNGTCAPNCTKANLTCPARAACSELTGIATCRCPIGYTLESNVCTWSGVLQDRGFQGTPATAWTIYPLNAGMSLEPLADTGGMQDTGYVHVTGDTMCQNGGPSPRVSQQFELPTAESSEPLALKVWAMATFPEWTYVNVSGAFYGTMGGAGIGLHFPVTTSGTFNAQRMCLGQLQYGGKKEVNFEVRAGSCPEGGTAGIDGYIDRVSIEPDNTCPEIGKVLNPDLELGTFGWTAGDWGYNAGFAQIVQNVGNGNSWGAKLSSTNDCQSSYLTVPISVPVPATLANAALRFKFHGSGLGQSAYIQLDTPRGGGTVGANISGGTPGFSTITVCLPEYAKGYSGTMYLHMPQATTCWGTSPDAREFVFDDFTIVTEPSCPAQATILDGDFEWPFEGAPWQFSFTVPGGSTGGLGGSPGSRYGTLTATKLSNGASMRQIVTAPSLPNGSYYQVQFSYRTTVTGEGGTFLVSNDYVGDRTLSPTGGAWSTATTCIPYAGAAANVSFRVEPGGSGNPGDTKTPQTLDVDDVNGSVVVGSCP